MEIVSKDIMEKWIIPHLSVGERGFERTVPINEIVDAIFHRLKTCCQWRELTIKHFFSGKLLSWNSVYHYFNAGGAARAV